MSYNNHKKIFETNSSPYQNLNNGYNQKIAINRQTGHRNGQTSTNTPNKLNFTNLISKTIGLNISKV